MMGASRELAELASSYNSGGLSNMRNRIINGDMRIDQRNAGASVTPTNGQFTVDRWFCALTQSAKYTAQQNAGSVTPPVGFTNYLGITSLSAYSVLTGDTFFIRQNIEGFNTADFAWGTASAVTVTLSFVVRSSITGTHSGSVMNYAGTRSYPFTFTVNAANTWETKSVTIPGDTTGTWNTNNSGGVNINFNLGSGSTFQGTAGAWAAGNFQGGATGSVSVVGTNGATFYITGVQLEKGSTATSFDVRDYGRELMLCQRYYFRLLAESIYTAFGSGVYDSLTSAGIYIKFPVSMRAAPTINQSNTATYDTGVRTVTGIGGVYAGKDSAFVSPSRASSGELRSGCLWTANNNTAAYVEGAIEL